MNQILITLLALTAFSRPAYAFSDSVELELNAVTENELNLHDETEDQSQYPDTDYHIKKVTERSVKLLGRGLENRKTGETLALACITENCSSLRFIYFTVGGKDAYLFGSPIRITSDGSLPTQEQTKIALKKIFKHFKDIKASANEKRVTYLIQGLAAGAGLTILFTASSGTGVLPTLIALGIVASGACLLIALNESAFTFHPATASFDDQNGWNWSSRAKKISSRNFNFMIAVENGRGDQNSLTNINYFRSND